MKGLITDRTPRDVYYRQALSLKGWDNMTTSEREEWLGDPFTTTGANLLPPGPYYSSSVSVKYGNEEIVATATATGTYLYAESIIGNASDYYNKKFTLSVESIIASGNGTPQIALFWHGDGGYEYAGASLLREGSVTFDTTEWANVNNRPYLALYIYVTQQVEVAGGAYARFKGVMLENGDTRHEYVPYVEIVPTAATRGAYNYSDLNRVERAVAEISEIAGIELVTKTNWTRWDIPTVSDMNRYLGNISAVRALIRNVSDVPPTPPSMSNLTHVEANNIEVILNAAYDAVKT